MKLSVSALLLIVVAVSSVQGICRRKAKPGDVTFTFVTRGSTVGVSLNESNLSIVTKKATIININGWMHRTTGPTSYFPNITKAYLEKGDYNIILVHAERLMFYSDEEISASYTDSIGSIIGDLIIDLHQKNELSLELFHIVGHALGAHIGGAAGRRVEQKVSKKIYRITALEVSKVGFENAPPSQRLDKTDAVVVDVIHTAAGQVGLNQSVGSADFWPNGGVAPQPGCDPQSQNGIFCSHDKSIWYFIFTLTIRIEAVKCGSYEAFKDHQCSHNEKAIFGDNYEGKVEGNLYLYLQCFSCDDDCKSSLENPV